MMTLGTVSMKQLFNENHIACTDANKQNMSTERMAVMAVNHYQNILNDYTNIGKAHFDYSHADYTVIDFDDYSVMEYSGRDGLEYHVLISQMLYGRINMMY